MRCRCAESTSSNDIPMKDHPRLFSEAGNIVLMRYLALIDYHGSLTAESVAIDGRLETSDYVNLFFDSLKIQRQKFRTVFFSARSYYF